MQIGAENQLFERHNLEEDSKRPIQASTECSVWNGHHTLQHGLTNSNYSKQFQYEYEHRYDFSHNQLKYDKPFKQCTNRLAMYRIL